MTPNEEAWTRNDLERFHDDDLDTERAAELRAALYRDPSLRNRLSDVRELDATVRAALAERSPATRARTFAVRRASVVAASIVIVGGAVMFAVRRAGREAPVPIVERSTSERIYEPIRVVLSVPVREGRRAVAERDAPRATDAAADVTGHPPAASLRDIGRALRSAPAAEAYLDELSPSEQLLTTRAWAADRTQPAVVFARLRALSVRPELAGEVRVVLAELAADARLRPWLRGYQLIGLEPHPETMPSNPS